MNLLVLSGYDADSHIEWHQQLLTLLGCQFDQIDVVTAPPRHFSWRVRSNGLWFADKVKCQRYDLIIATSMVELTALKALRPELAATRTLVYWHENQFAYPPTNDKHNLVHIQLSSIMSALSADQLVFNSSYNLVSFFEGARQLAQRVPDTLTAKHIDKLAQHSRVIPIAIENHWVTETCENDDLRDGKTIKVIWPHRWEFDKGLELLSAVLDRASDYPQLSFAICGQQFKRSPQSFIDAVDQADKRGQLWGRGYQPLDRFKGMLAEANVVLSTSDHEFQGLSMLRGIAANCHAVAPNALVYPEYVTPEGLYTIEDTRQQTAANLIERLLRVPNRHPEVLDEQYSEAAVQQAWRSVITDIANR